ncbi:MAG: hypothetical protein EBY04_03230 [Actinobacteria bacterium]|nr:hypothetical protein [Actinomycetota bacterium]
MRSELQQVAAEALRRLAREVSTMVAVSMLMSVLKPVEQLVVPSAWRWRSVCFRETPYQSLRYRISRRRSLRSWLS